MKFLFLVKKDAYINKMSRERFHSINAIQKHHKVEICDYFGIGWDGYDNNKTVQENIDSKYPDIEFDLVISYKPLEMKGFKDIRFKKCLRYNEMYDHEWTNKEIKESGADFVVCHHENDYFEYKEIYEDSLVNFANVPHSAEKTVFFDKGENRPYDILLVGAYNVRTILGEHYPLRNRMSTLLSQLPPKYKTGIYKHVGYNHNDAHTDKYLKDFNNVLNGSKLIITDAGAPKSRFGKYVEIPMCGAVIAGDIPDEHPEEFRKFVCEINMGMSDAQIINEIQRHLEDPILLRTKKEYGLKYASKYTHEDYANRFVNSFKYFYGE